MIGFFIKKNFCDGWDNLLWIIVSNLVSAALIVCGYLALSFIASIADTTVFFFACAIPVAAAFLFVLICLLTSISRECSRVSNYASPEYSSVFKNLFLEWKDSLYLTLILCFVFIVATVAIPWYLDQGTMLGILLSAFIGWFLILGIIALQWYFPLKAQLPGGFKKTFKKCFLLFFDNTGFSLFLFFYNLILTALSPFLAFLMPSFTGIILSQNNALRLRLYKYDWMEEHPELTQKEARKQIPWDELIADDRETLGPRTFRSFIFPWKD